MKKFFILLFLVFSALAYSQQNKAPKGFKTVYSSDENCFYKRIIGLVDEKFPFSMNLIRLDTALNGNLYYDKYRKNIPIVWGSSIDEKGKFYIYEGTGENYNEFEDSSIGYFTGNLKPALETRGMWFSTDSTRVFDFTMSEKYLPGSVKIMLQNKKALFDDATDTNNVWASVSVTYSIVSGNTSQSSMDRINEKVKEELLAYYVYENDTSSIRYYSNIDELINSFLNEYKEETFEDTLNPYLDIPWDLTQYIQPEFNESNILSLACWTQTYRGGAHGNYWCKYLNFDSRTGEIIKLDDIFKTGYEKKLNEIGEKIFRKNLEMKDGESLEEAGLWFEGNVFKLNDNFYFLIDGLLFHFNTYEIGPYAMGSSYVFIPYTKLKSIVKPKSILDELLKKS